MNIFKHFNIYRHGIIEYIGHDSDLEQTYKEIEADKVINAAGKCVVPGIHLCLFAI